MEAVDAKVNNKGKLVFRKQCIKMEQKAMEHILDQCPSGKADHPNRRQSVPVHERRSAPCQQDNDGEPENRNNIPRRPCKNLEKAILEHYRRPRRVPWLVHLVEIVRLGPSLVDKLRPERSVDINERVNYGSRRHCAGNLLLAKELRDGRVVCFE